jgi:hypothetical protein
MCYLMLLATFWIVVTSMSRGPLPSFNSLFGFFARKGQVDCGVDQVTKTQCVSFGRKGGEGAILFSHVLLQFTC